MARRNGQHEDRRVRTAGGVVVVAYFVLTTPALRSNYAPTILPQVEAASEGHTQVLWLFNDGEREEITEVGTMNFFILWVNEAGEKELVTAPLDGTILPGVTRDSTLELARQWGDFKVSERKLYIDEITAAAADGRVRRCRFAHFRTPF